MFWLAAAVRVTASVHAEWPEGRGPIWDGIGADFGLIWDWSGIGFGLIWDRFGTGFRLVWDRFGDKFWASLGLV